VPSLVRICGKHYVYVYEKGRERNRERETEKGGGAGQIDAGPTSRVLECRKARTAASAIPGFARETLRTIFCYS